ncbi:hypothetical protein L873DRAFT_1376005 [Choiromyces venosus 120613-1]|uniref:Uncharacterized protein n=1 Tax=Choiromyces venosus 120613-1 TaxID=1336337 RepID=A0A3N4JEH6_9PEZI|nr:hypothetical protein L873DRAFT_1376005 [Choiromyces venosus 120613-1]
MRVKGRRRFVGDWRMRGRMIRRGCVLFVQFLFFAFFCVLFPFSFSFSFLFLFLFFSFFFSYALVFFLSFCFCLFLFAFSRWKWIGPSVQWSGPRIGRTGGWQVPVGRTARTKRVLVTVPLGADRMMEGQRVRMRGRMGRVE